MTAITTDRSGGQGYDRGLLRRFVRMIHDCKETACNRPSVHQIISDKKNKKQTIYNILKIFYISFLTANHAQNIKKL